MQRWPALSLILPNSSHVPGLLAGTADVGGLIGGSIERVMVVAQRLCAVSHARTQAEASPAISGWHPCPSEFPFSPIPVARLTFILGGQAGNPYYQ
jgi:hypothetical protein